jgi:hypothetical protein
LTRLLVAVVTTLLAEIALHAETFVYVAVAAERRLPRPSTSMSMMER